MAAARSCSWTKRVDSRSSPRVGSAADRYAAASLAEAGRTLGAFVHRAGISGHEPAETLSERFVAGGCGQLARLCQMQHNIGHRPARAPGGGRPVAVVEGGEETIEFSLLLIQSSNDGFHSAGR